MHLREPTHTFLIVAAADARPLAVYRGLPLKTKKLALASPGTTLVYDVGKLEDDDHVALRDGLAVLRSLPWISAEAPDVLLVGGTPAMVIDGEGKQVHGGVGGALLDLIRDSLTR
jgi:hypothetical protein